MDVQIGLATVGDYSALDLDVVVNVDTSRVVINAQRIGGRVGRQRNVRK